MFEFCFIKFDQNISYSEVDLIRIIQEQSMVIDHLNRVIKEQSIQLDKYQQVIKELGEDIELLKNGRNSTTSHTPPSQDISRSNSKSLRVKSGKSRGGQSGHKGHTLSLSKNPSAYLDYIPNFCQKCGDDLSSIEARLELSKQEVVLPPIALQYVEHRSYSKRCLCGNKTKSLLPTHLKAPIQYSSKITSIVSYLNVYQSIPYYRLTLLMRDLFGCNLSQGTVTNMLTKTSSNLQGAYQTIKERLSSASVVGGDETGTRSSGKKAWFHAWQNTGLTYIAADYSRGFKATQEHFKNGFVKATYVSDCFGSQLKTTSKNKQLCLAHLLRELTSFEDSLKCKWSVRVKTLFKRAISLKQKLTLADGIKQSIITRLDEQLIQQLLTHPESKNKKLAALRKRLIKHHKSLLTFLKHPHVPFDNNGSERAIRIIKVKNKVSGQFQNIEFAKRYAVIQSIIDTTNKNKGNVLSTLTCANQ
jgi:transposase